MLGHVPFKDVADGVQVGAAIVIDHALGIAGGAGRVVQRDGVPLVGRRLPVERGGRGGQEGFVIGRAGQGGGRAVQVVHRDHGQVREFGAGALRQLGVLGVDDEGAGLAMAQHEQHAGRVQPRVQCVEHGAQHGHAEVRLDHGRDVRQHDGHGVAALDAGLRQRACKALRALVGLAPVAAHLTVDHGEPVAVHFGRAGDEVHRRERLVVGVATAQPMVVHAAHCLCLLPARLPALVSVAPFLALVCRHCRRMVAAVV